MEALIWRSAAAPLASLPCTSASVASSSSLLRVSIQGRRADAGLLLLEWSCSSSSSCKSQSHSRWLDESTVVFVDHARDANALLGRGAHEPPFENENDAQLQLFASPRLGRFVAARKAIPTGTCAMRATAFAVVVADRTAAKYCHWCFTQLTKKAFRCGTCEFALYCSRDCLEADAVLHDVQCATLRQLRDVTTLSPAIDKEMLRLTLAVIVMEAFVGNPLALRKLYVPTSTPRHAAQDLALDQAAKFLRRNLKKTSTPSLGAVTRAHIRETVLRIQSNAHPLYLNGSSGVCGVGIFPEASMTLNHSCSPNVVPSFEPKTRSLRFHAVRDIRPMELIEYSYLSDLAVGRARRQETLRDGFGFDCECPRCCRDGKATSGVLEISGSSGEEQEILTQLITLSAEKDPLAVGGKLRLLETRHSALLQSRLDVLFSIKMLELRSATQTSDWGRVLAVAETLLHLWDSQGLPKWYSTTETLHQQIAVAAMRLGDASRAREAMDTVHEIQRVCGFMLSSTTVRPR